MRHPTEGTLRRYLDEPLAVPRTVREHLGSCGSCRTRLEAAMEDRALAARSLHSAGTEPDTQGAYRRLLESAR
ncbi:hypothetical protein B1A_10404, partial [mine drainage metagenome]